MFDSGAGGGDIFWYLLESFAGFERAVAERFEGFESVDFVAEGDFVLAFIDKFTTELEYYFVSYFSANSRDFGQVGSISRGDGFAEGGEARDIEYAEGGFWANTRYRDEELKK